MLEAIAVIPVLRPGTSAGTRSLLQHLTPPPLASAQLGVIAVMPLPRPGTSTGVDRPPPQHLTPPASLSAQLPARPVAIAFTPPVRPATSTGTRRSAVVP